MRWVPLGLTLLVAEPQLALAWEHELDPSATWRGEVQYAVHLPVDPDLRAALIEELQGAVQAWQGSRCAAPSARNVGTTEREPNVSLDGEDGHTVLGFEERTWPYGHGVAAVTRLRARDGVIREADVLLNAVEYEWRTGSVAKEYRHLRQLGPTLLHELGHVWGLGHSMDPSAAMHANELNVKLAPDDVEGLCALYPQASPLPATTSWWWWLAIVGASVALWLVHRRQKQARMSAPPR
jgi:Matrixin